MYSDATECVNGFLASAPPKRSRSVRRAVTRLRGCAIIQGFHHDATSYRAVSTCSSDTDSGPIVPVTTSGSGVALRSSTRDPPVCGPVQHATDTDRARREDTSASVVGSLKATVECRRKSGDRFTPHLSYIEGRQHLPVIARTRSGKGCESAPSADLGRLAPALVESDEVVDDPFADPGTVLAVLDDPLVGLGEQRLGLTPMAADRQAPCERRLGQEAKP